MTVVSAETVRCVDCPVRKMGSMRRTRGAQAGSSAADAGRGTMVCADGVLCNVSSLSDAGMKKAIIPPNDHCASSLRSADVDISSWLRGDFTGRRSAVHGAAVTSLVGHPTIIALVPPVLHSPCSHCTLPKYLKHTENCKSDCFRYVRSAAPESP